MSEHTPGPWYVKDSEVRGGITGNLPIASMFCVQSQADLDAIEREANARLIAAAPDLLAVVEELVESVYYWSEYDVPLGIVDRMKAAIAKARGATDD